MQSLIIASKNQEIAEKEISKICREFKIDIFDITIIENEKSLGIEEIRNLKKTIFLKPFKSPKKAVVFKNAQTLTVEAQNALLKILEEPPPDTIIILSTLKADVFLPTIISRCKIIEFKEKAKTIRQTSEYLDILSSFENYRVGERLKLAQDISKDKETAINFLKEMILVLRERMFDQPKLCRTIISLQKTHTILSTTNANPRLALENLFLNF